MSPSSPREPNRSTRGRPAAGTPATRRSGAGTRSSTGASGRRTGARSKSPGATRAGTESPRRTGRGSGEAIAGRHAVVEALRAGVRLERILTAPGSKAAPILTEIRQLSAAAGVPVHVADRQTLDALANGTVHQGVVAVAGPFAYADAASLLGAPSPRLVLLDGVTDPANLGSILRSAEAFGFTGILVPKHRSVGVTATVRKVAAGAADRVPIALVTSPADAVLRCRDHDIIVVGLDPDAPASYRSLEPGSPVCLVVGAEGKGLSRLVRERCDQTVRIPMHGKLASLNAAVATAVVMSWITDEG